MFIFWIWIQRLCWVFLSWVFQWHPVLTAFQAFSVPMRTALFSMTAIMPVRRRRCRRCTMKHGGGLGTIIRGARGLVTLMSCHCWVMSAWRWWWRRNASSGLVLITWTSFGLVIWTLGLERKPLIGFKRCVFYHLCAVLVQSRPWLVLLTFS